MAIVDQPYADPAAGGQPPAQVPRLAELPEFVTAGGLFELVFAAPKSVSAYWALLLQDRGDDAAKVVDAHAAAVAAALAYLSREGTWAAVRTGESKLPLYLDSHGLRHIELTHGSSDLPPGGGRPAPHLHTHVYVDWNVVAVEDRQPYTLDWPSLDREFPMAAAVYDGNLEETLVDMGVAFLRGTESPSGRGEIKGISDNLLNAFAYSQCTGPVTAVKRVVITDSHRRPARLHEDRKRA